MNKKSCLLPRLRRKDSQIMRSRQTVFGGLSSCPYASGQEISYMSGMSPHAYPAMGTQETRFEYDISDAGGVPRGIHRHDTLVMAKGNGLYAVTDAGEHRLLCTVSDTDKVFASFGSRLFVLPDAICCDTEAGTVRPLTASSGYLSDVVMGENYLTHSTTDWEAIGFAVGDAVEISVKDYVLGSTTVFERKVTDISNGTLFLEPSFERTGAFDISVTRRFPELDHLTVLGDRLMGCKGHTVYLSEAGNPFNWTVGQALDSDPVSLNIGGAGEITACATYSGDGVFFKEDRFYRLVGHGSRDYVLSEVAAPGVAAGCAASLCEAAGRLFYLSPGGVCALDGDQVDIIGQTLPYGLTKGVGGTDGVCYYLAAYDTDGVSRLYAYPWKQGQWYVQDIMDVTAMTSRGDLLYFQTAEGQLLRNRREGESLPKNQAYITEAVSALPSSVIFGDAFGDSPDGLRLHAIHIRAEADKDALMSVMISYDRGPWTTVATVSGQLVEPLHIPVYPVRAAAYRLRLDMSGVWKVYEIICDCERGKQ